MSIVPDLVAYCAPTLASIKTGSLFGVVPEDWDAFAAECQRLACRLAGKGLSLQMIPTNGHRALIYLYRPSQLQKQLDAEETQRFLSGYGYAAPWDTETVVDALCEKLRLGGCFPHEIGIFLGYPLADVVGFIRNKGKNCLCSGCWKAYTDAHGALRAFERIRKCQSVYQRLYSGGRTLEQLTVAA